MRHFLYLPTWFLGSTQVTAEMERPEPMVMAQETISGVAKIEGLKEMYPGEILMPQIAINFLNIPAIAFELWSNAYCDEEMDRDYCDTKFLNHVGVTMPFYRLSALFVNIVYTIKKLQADKKYDCDVVLHKDYDGKTDEDVCLEPTFLEATGIAANIGGFFDVVFSTVPLSKWTHLAEWGSISKSYLFTASLWFVYQMIKLSGLETGDVWYYWRGASREFGRVLDLAYSARDALEARHQMDKDYKRPPNHQEYTLSEAIMFNSGVWHHIAMCIGNVIQSGRLWVEALGKPLTAKYIYERKGAWSGWHFMFGEFVTRVAHMAVVLVQHWGHPGFYSMIQLEAA